MIDRYENCSHHRRLAIKCVFLESKFSASYVIATAVEVLNTYGRDDPGA